MKIYMFHYVTRDFNYFHFDVDEFENTIKELIKHYRIIGLIELYDRIEEKKELKNCIMLTFDDGTKDHYKYVYPILKKYNVPGVFFISSNIIKGEILDIHIIHQLFAKVGVEKLYDDLVEELKKREIVINDKEFITTKFDEYKMKYVKQLLQFILSREQRTEIINTFIKKYKISEKSEDYYITNEELKEMKNNNMQFGLHTKSHVRLDRLSLVEQREEIIENYKLLTNMEILTYPIAIAYPFGVYNDDTLKILIDNNIEMGFAIDGDETMNNLLEIKRHDANEFKEKR